MTGVERDLRGEVEVDVMRADGTALEVGLDSALRVVEVEVEVEVEDAGDE